MSIPFEDRLDAGRQLAQKLMHLAGDSSVLILGLPRGGVPVAFEIARLLNKPLDVFVVRKLGVPGHEELAMGAIASGGVRVLNEGVIHQLGISERLINQATKTEMAELERREKLYRGSRPPPPILGSTVVLVDDGLATGSSMRAAVLALRRLAPMRIVVAVPVAAEATCVEFEPEVDEIVCAETPKQFQAVSLWYANFSQTTDEEVRSLLDKWAWEQKSPV